VARLTWNSVSIPQNAIPFTEHGHSYLLEFDEYTASTLNPQAPPDIVGAGRIIDLADEAHPRVIANLRLQVNQPSDHRAAQGDPGTFSGAQGYADHYCNIPSRTDPKVVACSFIASGLRVFDISDLLHPKEIAYYVAPTAGNTENGYQGSDYAMSQPAIIPARREIWYTDGGSGFYVVRVSPSVWPTSQAADLTAAASPGGGECALRRLTFRLHPAGFGPIHRVRVLVNGRLALTRQGRRLRSVTVVLPGSGPQTIRIVTYDRRGRARRSVRKVAACVKTRPHTRGRRSPHRRR
jgi:hypothetical protein